MKINILLKYIPVVGEEIEIVNDKEKKKYLIVNVYKMIGKVGDYMLWEIEVEENDDGTLRYV